MQLPTEVIERVDIKRRVSFGVATKNIILVAPASCAGIKHADRKNWKVNLRLLNFCLLMKWRWWFYHKHHQPWWELINRIHFLNHPPSHITRSGQRKVPFPGFSLAWFSRWVLGNTAFWHDCPLNLNYKLFSWLITTKLTPCQHPQKAPWWKLLFLSSFNTKRKRWASKHGSLLSIVLLTTVKKLVV